MASAYTNGESEDGEFLAVYLVCGSVLSLSFVEPHKRDRPNRSQIHQIPATRREIVPDVFLPDKRGL